MWEPLLTMHVGVECVNEAKVLRLKSEFEAILHENGELTRSLVVSVVKISSIKQSWHERVTWRHSHQDSSKSQICKRVVVTWSEECRVKSRQKRMWVNKVDFLSCSFCLIYLFIYISIVDPRSHSHCRSSCPVASHSQV